MASIILEESCRSRDLDKRTDHLLLLLFICFCFYSEHKSLIRLCVCVTVMVSNLVITAMPVSFVCVFSRLSLLRLLLLSSLEGLPIQPFHCASSVAVTIEMLK